MRRTMITAIQLVLLSGIFLIALSCGASHRLKEYTFKGLTAAAVISAPRPEVLKDSFLHIDAENLVATALRVGTIIAKEATADEAQSRLNSAMTQVNVPEIIRYRTLSQCSQYLRLQPIEDADGADFLLDLFVDHYGIDAESWDAGVYFELKMDVILVDNATGQQIWKTTVKEHQPISRNFFFVEEQAADNIITAIALSQLSTEDMALGFQRLAEDVSERAARRLRKDYYQSRQGATGTGKE